MRIHELFRDPRHYQILILSSLAGYGVMVLDLDVEPMVAWTILSASLGVQFALTRWLGLPRFDPRSPLISALSLILLLRTRSLAVALVAAVLTIASKFSIRVRDKHVFNPTNFGLAVTMLLFDGAWVSQGQWGSGALVAFAAACLGLVVVYRAERSDVTWAILGFWSLILFSRAAWLGDPLSIPLHQIQTGAFLIFAFFMISDPKTTPDRRGARILYAAVVASVAAWIQFGLFEPNALIWALFLCAPVVPLTDRFLPGLRYRWPSPPVADATSPLLHPDPQGGR
ncbi:MAG: RnfABCDGE type electron transport complex subunit D [Thermoanaerobaculia bacterium]|nr:RnfABCDGE type electron transport complex subunit D [Thermoanaerobaculia bacterium]